MTVRRLLALPLLGVLLTGCGIRATEVPTDFGAAPSRVPCSLAGPDVSAQSSRGVPVQVFLLCGASLVAVDRAVRVPEGTPDAQRRMIVAQGLLDQLATSPSAAERSAGYTTYVPGGLGVRGPGPKDPEDALRLSTAPSRLTSYALAQLVCTLSDSAATEDNGSVILGGPGPGPLRRYECTDDVRDHPGTTRPPSGAVTGG
ncbi:lipoprotein [Streptomyces rameus]|uniref:Lipoprotein n=1 Tax=Streptomyces rameus TaxID=68261 RepID=A0ABP6MZK3_9ACTN